MTIHRNANESEPSLGPCIPNRPGEPAGAPFHYYLELVCQPLRSLAPDAWVADLRAELASHLDCLAEAYEELGEDRETAIVQACRSLGDPAQLGAQWADHWREKRPEPFRATVKEAFTYFAVAAVLSAAMFLISMKSVPGVKMLDDLLRIWGVLIMPVHAGILFGRNSRGRRGPAAALAIVFLAGVIALLGAVLPGSDESGLRPFLWQIALVYTLPLGTAATAITGRLQAWRKRRARIA